MLKGRLETSMCVSIQNLVFTVPVECHVAHAIHAQNLAVLVDVQPRVQ